MRNYTPVYHNLKERSVAVAAAGGALLKQGEESSVAARVCTTVNIILDALRAPQAPRRGWCPKNSFIVTES